MNRLQARLGYYVRDAWESVRYSPGVNLLAFGTLLAVLVLCGLLLLLVSNIGGRLESARSEIRVDIYLIDGITETQQEAVRGRLAEARGVDRVEYVGKARAMELYEKWNGSMAGLLDSLNANPLPASFQAFLDPGVPAGEVAGELAAELEGAAGVEEVRYDREWLDRMDAMLILVRAGGSLALGAVLLVVIFVVASVLRLAVFARRDEIDIMLLVGATPAFVRGPFMVAGLGMGLAGGLAALGLVELIRRLFLAGSGEAGTILVSLLAGNPLTAGSAAVLVVTGVVVSLLAAFVAVRQDMGVQSSG